MPTSGPHTTTEDDGNWGEDIWIEMLEEKTTTKTTTTKTTTTKTTTTKTTTTKIPTTLKTTTFKPIKTVENKMKADCDIHEYLDRVLN